MSNINRTIARKREDARPVRKGQKLTPVKMGSGASKEDSENIGTTKKGSVVMFMNLGRHVQGGSWWRRKAAELAEKKIKKAS